MIIILKVVKIIPFCRENDGIKFPKLVHWDVHKIIIKTPFSRGHDIL